MNLNIPLTTASSGTHLRSSICSTKTLTSYCTKFFTPNAHRHSIFSNFPPTNPEINLFSEKDEWEKFNLQNTNEIKQFSRKLAIFLDIKPHERMYFNDLIKHVISYKLILMNMFKLSDTDAEKIEALYKNSLEKLISLNQNHRHQNEILHENLTHLLNKICNFYPYFHLSHKNYVALDSIILPIIILLFDTTAGVFYDYWFTEKYFCTVPPSTPLEHCRIEGQNLIDSIFLSAVAGSFITGTFISTIEKAQAVYENKQNKILVNLIQKICSTMNDSTVSHFKSILIPSSEEEKSLLYKAFFYGYEVMTDALPSWLPQLIPDTPKVFYEDFKINLAVGLGILITGSIIYYATDFIYNQAKINCFSTRTTQISPKSTVEISSVTPLLSEFHEEPYEEYSNLSPSLTIKISPKNILQFNSAENLKMSLDERVGDFKYQVTKLPTNSQIA